MTSLAFFSAAITRRMGKMRGRRRGKEGRERGAVDKAEKAANKGKGGRSVKNVDMGSKAVFF